MRLRKLVARNFRLLRDVTLQFSTDPDRPLTTIRAENGTGKTSVLFALIWGFYGRDGLPWPTNEPARLSSTLWPPGTPCPIEVTIDFEVADEDEDGDYTHYTLVRTVIETPTTGDTVEVQREKTSVFRHTDAGADLLPDADAAAVLRRYAPTQMKDIYFTDGDSAQNFITGQLGTEGRQQRVHAAIQSLLGLTELRTARDDLTRAAKTLRQRLAKEANATDLDQIGRQIDAAEAELDVLTRDADKTTERLAAVTDSLARRQKSIDELSVLGRPAELKAERQRIETSARETEASLTAVKRQQRELLKSADLSWALMGGPLDGGLALLRQLHDRGVIPGTSQQVLRDRLDLELCICGESLAPGSEHRAAVEKTLAEQAINDPRKERLTQLLYSIGGVGTIDNDPGEDTVAPGWLGALDEVERVRAGLEHTLRVLGAELAENEEAMRKLGDADIERLYEQRDKEQKQREELLLVQRENTINQDRVRERLEDLARQEAQARSKVKVGDDLRDRVDVANDLLTLLAETLKTLEGATLQAASARLNELFLEIIGANPDHEAAVITGAELTADFDIRVLSAHGRTLDPRKDEISGAQKRALTLSFIWALMEIAEVAAPRIIDTPLGMMSGGLKHRFVDLLTSPSGQEFQIVLLLTRSEIATVEDLLDARAGVSQTITCSKDVSDLVTDWGAGRSAEVRACVCTHRESCEVCARKDDAEYGLRHRFGEVV